MTIIDLITMFNYILITMVNYNNYLMTIIDLITMFNYSFKLIKYVILCIYNK